MTLSKINRFSLWFVCLAALILIADTTAVRTLPSADTDHLLGYAIVFDFVLAIPLLYWLLIERPRGKSVRKAVPLTIVGAAAAWFVLPPALREAVWQVILPLELLIVPLEIFIIVYEIRLLFRFIRRYRHVARLESNTAEALRSAMKQEFGSGKLSAFLLHDLTMFYYLLFSWNRKRAEAAPGELTYTYHRKTSQFLYAGIITHVVVFESVFVHILVQMWSQWAAWLLTAADVWILALLWADCRASALSPVTISSGRVRIRYGLRLQADIPLNSIAGISTAAQYEPDAAERKSFAIPLSASLNVRIELNRPIQTDGFLFMPREAKGLYLMMDDPQTFVRDVKQALGH
ncbi:hypothetical protein [Paenibacillus hamazuiensis]|uniref:hypothetical protein n=1 Tax=Paenibacillus hamazuiensis TaxID=2936508 RepID=UPI0020108793|nr:hypothetical protein [Paenibacillus hamazuiensis]